MVKYLDDRYTGSLKFDKPSIIALPAAAVSAQEE
jgi:hypothetical protein